MNYQLEVEQEDDGRWIAEIINLPGVMAYGDDRDAAIRKAEALGLRVIAERLESEERPAESFTFSLPIAA